MIRSDCIFDSKKQNEIIRPEKEGVTQKVLCRIMVVSRVNPVKTSNLLRTRMKCIRQTIGRV